MAVMLREVVLPQTLSKARKTLARILPLRPIPLCLIALTPLLSACETSMRLPPLGGSFGNSDRVAARPPAAPRIETAPSARVDSSPLAPPPGSGEISQPSQPVEPGVDAADGTTPGTSQPTTTPSQPPQTARVEPPKVAPKEESSGPTRSSVTGNWNAREAAGGSCRVTLSSSPKLDLYGASTSGCQSRDLQRVTAWELRGEEVYLYEPGGAVAARLKARSRSMDGTLAKTGAPLTLSK